MRLLSNLSLKPVEACPLCASKVALPEFQRRFYDHLFGWVRCQECSLVYQNPRLTPESLREIYNSPLYWEGEQPSLGYRNYLESASKRAAQAHQRARLVVNHCRPGAQVLDVGCAAGFFLDASAQVGLRPTGLEISSPMAALARERFGHRVWEGSITTFEPPHRFQAVTAWGCDSNFDQPVASFQRLALALEPGGHLFFNFYDYDHWFRPWLGEFKKVYNALYFLNRGHVERLLERAGCEQLELRPESHYATLGQLAYHTGRVWLGRLLQRLNLSDLCLRLPVPGSFVVVARRL